MLSTEQNEMLTRVGPGTPMGDTLRRYWIPALMSFEIPEPDGPPARVKVLGEELVAFRSTDGRIGLIDEFCAHRRASLWFGRNEECGLRCVYHGWKFDIEGNCVDQMNEPRQFADRVKLAAYPTVEMGGIVWAYLGPRDKMPEPPEFELTQVPESHRYMTKVWQECNWLQALEGGIDTSHAPILHRKLTNDTDQPGIPPDSPFVQGAAPELAVDLTDYGYRYYGVRPLGDQGNYVRAYHYVMPFTQIRPSGTAKPLVDGHFWVPMDDQNVMVYNWGYSWGEEPLLPEESTRRGSGNNFYTDVDVESGFRSVRNRDNDYQIDRQVQKQETFTGIRGVNTQDRAIQESMGRIVDRTKEFLGPADMAIVTTRKLLVEAVSTVMDGGDPPGVAPTYHNARSAEAVIPFDLDWREALMESMYPTEPAATVKK
ncbi:MAG: Rieske 2Fe-2S domain-containing protein [Dehalococcoidia bacterium]